jgi:peptidyl-prolyl cis-trans isomerase C
MLLLGLFHPLACTPKDTAPVAKKQTPATVQGAKAPKPVGPAVLVQVNGVAITEADVEFRLARMRQSAHGKAVAPELRQNILKQLVDQELVYQKARAAGLDQNADYQRRLGQLRAQVVDYQRREMWTAFYRTKILGQAGASEAEVRKYYDANKDRIEAELHVGQILVRGKRADAEATLAKIRSGTTFEDVARERFKTVAGSLARPPWDLGYLRWNQLPSAWDPTVYRLKKGEVSGVIEGPRSRYWIVKLIDRRASATPTFDQMKGRIEQILKRDKTEVLTKQLEQELRAKAKIVYVGR